MLQIDLLKKGDEVLTISDNFLAIRRKNGTVDIFKVLFDENNEIYVDPLKIAVIGYGEGIIGKALDDGETTVYTF